MTSVSTEAVRLQAMKAASVKGVKIIKSEQVVSRKCRIDNPAVVNIILQIFTKIRYLEAN